MKEIRIQYPYDPAGKNPNYDGRLHDIKPNSLFSTTIRGIPFYVLTYHDLTLNSDMITLLVDIKGQIVKVPLDNYNIFPQFLRNTNMTPISPKDIDRILPKEIELSEQIDAANLFPPVPQATANIPEPPNPPRGNNYRNRRNDVLDISLYVPTRDNESIRTVYRPSHILTEAYSDEQTFKFDEAPVFSRLYQEIVRNRKKNGTSEFDIDVAPGTTASQVVLDEKGMPVVKLLLLIPGTHHYTVTYADTLSKQKYDAASKSESAEITAKVKDRESMVSAFRGGFLGRLPIKFSGRFLGNNKRQFNSFLDDIRIGR